MSLKLTLRDLSRIAIFAAIIAVLTLPGEIPLAIGVPISFQTLGVMLAGVILGAYRGTIAAENRLGPNGADGEPQRLGARFIVRLPVQG